MSEAILIEIASRFRGMEDFVERADTLLAAYKETSLTTMELDEIVEVRYDLERAVELCRDDMVAMQELIRGKA